MQTTLTIYTCRRYISLYPIEFSSLKQLEGTSGDQELLLAAFHLTPLSYSHSLPINIFIQNRVSHVPHLSCVADLHPLLSLSHSHINYLLSPQLLQAISLLSVSYAPSTTISRPRCPRKTTTEKSTHGKRD